MNEDENLQTVESADDAALWDEVVSSMNGGSPQPSEPEDQDDEPQETDESAPEAEGDQDPEDTGPTIEDLKAEREALLRERDDWRHRYQSDQGRFLAAQRKLAELHNTQKQAPPSDEQQREQAAAGVQAMKAGRFQEFASEFPEMAEAITDYFNSQKQELLNTFNQEFEPIKQRHMTQIEQDERTAFNEAVSALSSRHPDWEQYNTGTNADFSQWLSAQPAEMQSLYGRPDPHAASRLIDFYKFDKGMAQQAPRTNERAEKIQQQRQQRLERSTLPATRGGSVTTDPDDALWESVIRQVEGKR